MDTDDRLARLHREYREECIRAGTYRPFTEEEHQRAITKWKAECSRPPRQVKKRKNPPKGHAD